MENRAYFCHLKLNLLLKVSRVQPSVYALVMNGSMVEIEAHRMTDCSLLLSVGGASHVTYMKEEVEKYCVVIGGKTCVFDKENDPRVLRSSSPGKLLKYTVDDGEHVNAGQPYAEIEVMKMVANLMTVESGM